MANTKLQTNISRFVSAEALSSKFAASATLATATATIPANVGGVWVYVSAACHWNPIGTATATFQHAVPATSWFYIPTAKVTTAQIIGDAGAINVVLVYERGARAGKNVSGDMTRPY